MAPVYMERTRRADARSLARRALAWALLYALVCGLASLLGCPPRVEVVDEGPITTRVPQPAPPPD